MNTVTYEGRLAERAWGEGDDILYCDAADRPDYDDPLAERIKDDIEEYGSYLTIRYWISPEPLPTEDERTEVVARAGLGYPKVGHAYSEYTGYLWTDEEINVGGHDLIMELHHRIGSWLRLEIDYSKEGTDG